nr:hypothetical protein 18 [Moraxellaceae bacterium]
MKRKEAVKRAKARGHGGADESPFKPGTKQLKKGWKYVDGVPVKVRG